MPFLTYLGIICIFVDERATELWKKETGKYNYV